MKIQCACGAKYAFDATPEMLQNPVKFVCPSCGLDSSDFVNELIRREFAGQTPAAPPPATKSPRLKISHAGSQPSAPADETAPAPAAEEHCPKHPRELAVEHCVVCGKPMCRQCMKLFGHVCSPLCRAKAEAQNINIPVYAGQSTVADARYWRKAGTIGGLIAVVVVAALGFWTWYAWVGSVPRPVFSVRFDDRAYAGESRLCGTNQIVFLHGGTLARYDIKSGNEIWSDDLVTNNKSRTWSRAKTKRRRPTSSDKNSPKPDRRIGGAQSGGRIAIARFRPEYLGEHAGQAHALRLGHRQGVAGNSAGEPRRRIHRPQRRISGHRRGRSGQALVTHINPATGESRVEEISQPGPMTVAQNASGAAGGTGIQPDTGLPLAPGTGPMNPAAVGEQAQNLSLPGRIALPALEANNAEQERIAEELNEQDQTRPGNQPPARPPKPAQNAAGYFTLDPRPERLCGIRCAAAGIAHRHARSHAGPAGKIRAERQRQRCERNSGHQRTIERDAAQSRRRQGAGRRKPLSSPLRRPDSTGAADWTGQVTGPPALFPLKTVNVLAAGKTLIVFDKRNKKLWQATLTYNVAGGNRAADGETPPFGDGPCVEQGGTLYVFDQAVLTAFDIATGNARWRLPSVGIVGLFFDNQGMLFVNTTTADPENIKYSRQIDITQKIEAILLKIDPQTGRTLWSVKPGGFISYLSGKYIYTVQSFDPGDDNGSVTGIELPAYLKIRRISPADGHVLWEQDQPRAPLNVRFKNNFIELVFKKEVQVLKYLSL